MNSSISSFKSELKVFLVVLAVVGSLEIAQRINHSGNLAETSLLRDFPLQADQLASQPGTSIILLGNSLTQNGYDMPQLDHQLRASGHDDLHIAKIALSGSNPIEWYHVFDHAFVRRGKTPDVIVINMSPSGISDELPAGYRIGWLANETTWADVPEVLFGDLKNVEVCGQYLQARVSMLYADRWDLRASLLSRFIPDLWNGLKWVNAGQAPPANIPPRRPRAAPPKTYSLLTRLLQLAQSHGARIILVAMPAREPYALEPAMQPTLREYHVAFIDARTIPGLTPDGFEDGWHLNPRGAQLFTDFMAAKLPPAIKSLAPRTQPNPSTTHQ